jgi:hypothetical protein
LSAAAPAVPAVTFAPFFVPSTVAEAAFFVPVVV